MIAVTMPGKMGDALYALPVCRELYRQTGELVDFYTSEYCAPLKNLIKYQDCIREFVIPKNYRAERMDMGVQPWFMPVESVYSQIFHLGFRRVPDRSLPDFMALEAGIDKSLPIEYNYPEMGRICGQPFVVFAPRGSSSYANMFLEVARALIARHVGVVVIGGKGENYFEMDEILNPWIVDYTGHDMLQTVGMMSKAIGFVGLMSSQLVLANGFNFPKIAPHDGIHWDMRHVVYSDSNFYPVNPSAEKVVELLGI